MHVITIGIPEASNNFTTISLQACKYLVYFFHLVETASLECIQQTICTPNLKLNCNNIHKMTKVSAYYCTMNKELFF